MGTDVAIHREIAKVRTAVLGWEDHGILAVAVDFDFGGSGQGIGGYALDEPVHDEHGKFVKRVGTAYGMEFVARVMRACGVDEWSKVVGRTVFAIRDGDGWGAKIVGIAPLPTEPGEPFLFDDLRREFFVDDEEAVT
jgi:hypothetical protein